MVNKLDSVLEKLVALCQDKKADRVTSYRLSDASWITDFIVLVTVKNTVHCKALIEDLSQHMVEFSALSANDFYDRPRIAGNAASGWVILDMNSIVVHCVTESVRDFYKLDTFFEKRGVAFHY